MAHPETLLPMPTIDDPLERFVSVVKFYLSGWHIKPPYVHSTCSHSVFKDETTSLTWILQRREEAAESDSRRDLHLLLGLP